MLDAIVIGAGPAGNQAALSLARRGRSVLVLDHRTRLGDKLCTGIIGRECAERFELPPELVLHAASSVEVVSQSARPLRVERDRPQAYVIDRVAFVQTIAGRASDAGAEYLPGAYVEDVAVGPDSVRVTVRRSGRSETHQARAVAVASGLGSPVARTAGLTPAAPAARAAQAMVYGTGFDTVTVFVGGGLPPGTFGWLVPAGEGRALAGALGRTVTGEHVSCVIEEARSRGARIEQCDPAGMWGVPLRTASRTYGGRVVLAGDVAGQVKPITGGGIYYSLISGEAAGEALDGAIADGDLSAASLARYERAWRSLLGHELRAGYLGRSIFERLDGRAVARLLDLAAANGLLRGDLRFDWHGDLVYRALGYHLFESLLAPFRAAASAVGDALRHSAD